MPDSSGSIDLSNIGGNKQSEDAIPDFSDLPEDVQERLRERAGNDEPTAPERTKVATAFLVVVHEDGQVAVEDFDNSGEYLISRKPVPDDMYGASAVVMKDISASETARATLEFQMMQARAMQEQMQSQQIAQNLNLGGR